MGQEPHDRLWAAVYVLIAIALLAGLTTIIYAENTRNFLEVAQELDYESSAILCMSVVVDNDRNFDIPRYCDNPEVVVHFPPEVCEVYFTEEATCGDKWGP